MRQGVLGEFSVVAAGFHHDVVFRAASLGHEVVRHVRNGEQELAAFFLGRFHGFFLCFCLFFQAFHFALDAFSLVLFPLLHQCADALGERFHLCVETVNGCLRRLAAVIDFEHALNGFACAFKMFFLQTAYHGFLVIKDLFDCKHAYNVFYCAKLRIYFEFHIT